MLAVVFSIILVIVKPYYYQKIFAALGGVGFIFLAIKTYFFNKIKP